MLLRLVTCCLLAGLFFPRPSQAWTRAHVREAHARIELVDRGKANVALELVVDVQGGWLERLELPLLDDDLALADPPAQVTLESGEQLAASASAKASVVTLKFARRDGIRRGLHRLQVRYTTDLLGQATRSEAGDLRVSWTLPGWQSGLLTADVVLAARQPLRAVSDPELAQDVTSTEENGMYLVRFARMHVPRASQWRVEVDVPSGLLAGRASAVRPAPAEARDGWGGWLSVAFCLVATLVGRQHVRRRLMRHRLPARSPLGYTIPGWILVLVAALGAVCWPRYPVATCLWLLVLPALAFEVAYAPPGPLPLGGFQPLVRADRRRLRWARSLEWLGIPGADVTTLAGLASAAGLVALVLVHGAAFRPGNPWGLVLLCALPGWALSSRLRLPRSLAAQVALLTRAARQTRTVGCALGLVWYVAGQVRDQPRLRLTPRARYAGLLRLEVMVDSRRAADPLVLAVLVEADSPAERWTRSLWPTAIQERSPGGPRLALLKSVSDLSAAIEQLLEHYTRESQRAFAEPESRAA